MEKVINYISDYITDLIKIFLCLIIFDKLLGFFFKDLNIKTIYIISDIIMIIIKPESKKKIDIFELLDVPIKVALARTIIKLTPYLIKFLL